MADILIRGMEMPQRCKACRFCGFGGRMSELNVCMFTGESQPKLSQERMSKCPLVPLPEGHGDLIDRDAFRADNGLNAKCEHCPTNTYECQHDMIHTKMEFCEMLDDAPVIVPAEGGTDDG